MSSTWEMTGGGKGDGSGINTILRTRLSQGYAAANIIMRSGRGGRDTSLSVCVCMRWWTIVATTTTPIASSSPPGRMGNEENNNRNVNNNNNKARVWSRPVFVVHLASQSRLHTSSRLMAFRLRGTSGKMALKCDLLHPHSQVFRPFLNVEWEIRQSSNLLQSPAFACEEDGYRHVECNLTLDCTPTKNLSLSLPRRVEQNLLSSSSLLARCYSTLRTTSQCQLQTDYWYKADICKLKPARHPHEK